MSKFSDKNKIFIGGIPRDVKEEDFRALFAPFGELTDCVIIKDKYTGESRGFGFVSYSDDSSVDKVLAQTLELGGRKLDCKSATPRPADSGKTARERRRRAEERERRGGPGRDRSRRRPRYDPYDYYGYEDEYDRPRGGYRTYDLEDGYGARRGGYRGYEDGRGGTGASGGGFPYSTPPPPPPTKTGTTFPVPTTPVTGGAFGGAYGGAYGGLGAFSGVPGYTAAYSGYGTVGQTYPTGTWPTTTPTTLPFYGTR